MIAPRDAFHNPEEKSGALIQILFLFLFFVVFHLCFRAPYLWNFGFVNEDASLIRLASHSLKEHGPWYWFYHSYGPGVLRPIQLLSLALMEMTFQGKALMFHATSICILALGQLLFVQALRRRTGVFAAVLAALVAGIAQISAEPQFWISDQHDLFLFVFFSCSLLYSSIFVEKSGKGSLIPGLLLFLSFWGGFLSNEKGVVVPVLLSIFTLLLAPRSFLKISAVGAFSLLTYFAYRYSILGVFIGGYESGMFPRKITLAGLGRTYLSVLFTPFRQWSYQASICGGILGTAMLATVYGIVVAQSRNKTIALLALFAFFLCLAVAALPVMSYLLPYHSYAVFSTRLHWLILLTYLPFLAFLFSAAQHVSKFRKTAIGLCLCLLLMISAGGRDASRRFARASMFTEKALELFSSKCTCANPRQPQTTGLPEHFAQVNVYTEPVWIEEHALYLGMKRCDAGEVGCKLRFRRNARGQLLVKERER